MGIRIGIITVLALLGLLPGKAHAHPMLDRAVAAYENADFEQALKTFDTAARNADLSIDELLQLFEMRALVHHALGNEAQTRADLHRVLAVRASYELSRLAPPSLRTVFDEVREAHGGENGVELSIDEESIDGEQWIVARVLRVPDDLVDHTTLQCDVASDGRTVSRTSRGTSTSLKLPSPDAHRGCTATARTRQGGVLFIASIDKALPLAPPVPAAGVEMPRYVQRDDRRETKRKKWPWIVAVVGAAVVGGVTAGVIVSQRSKNSSQPQTGAVTVNW